MMEAQDGHVEELMWSATRGLEEQAEYISLMEDQIADGEPQSYAAKSRSALQKAAALRKLISKEP
jgi:hypothetical protein